MASLIVFQVSYLLQSLSIASTISIITVKKVILMPFGIFYNFEFSKTLPLTAILGKWTVDSNIRRRLRVYNLRSMEHQNMLRKVWEHHDKTQPSKIAKRTFSTAADIAVKMLKD